MYALAAASDLANHQSYGGLELNEFELIDVYSGCVGHAMAWVTERHSGPQFRAHASWVTRWFRAEVSQVTPARLQ